MRKLENNELQRLNVEDFKTTKKIPLIIILDNIRSLSNIGSVFRTSDAFLIKEIILCGITATPPHREIQKTALGATESVAWKYISKTTTAVEELKSKGVSVYAVEQAEESTMLNNFNFNLNRETALVFGNEVKGVDDEVMKIVDGAIEIPQFGTKHSLNISISVGIVIWEFFKTLKSF